MRKASPRTDSLGTFQFRKDSQRWSLPSHLVLLSAFLGWTLMCASIDPAQQAKPKPLTKEDVIILLKGQLAPKRIGEIARERGMAFELTPDAEKELREAGATDEVFKAIREMAPPILLIEAIPGGAQVYVDDESAGKTGPEGRLRLSTLAPGEHRVRFSLDGYRDEERRIELKIGQQERLEVKLEPVAPGPKAPTPAPREPAPAPSQPAPAGEPCRSYAANSPEDELMQAYSGADNPQEQITALDKFAQAHSDSTFMPCVDGFYASAYFKLSNFEKAIEYGEKAVALNYKNLNLLDSLVSSYLASGKVSDSAFDLIVSAADEIKSETVPTRSANMSDADWQKAQQDAAAQADEWRQRMANSFFQILFRVPDGSKQLALLDRFAKAFPEAATKSAGPLNFHYALAYAMTNQVDKADEYGEKAIAADPSNIEALNLVAYDYAVIAQKNMDKASTYAEKALNLAQNLKKPEGVPEEQFKVAQKNQMGKAHLTLGYVAFSKGAKTKRLTPAIQELKAAGDLLDANPQLKGQALYYLGYAYQEIGNYHAAIDALTTASNLGPPWQGPAQDLLKKIKQRTGGK